jgi:NADH-quinone oxidoreductase subunit J
MVMALDLRSAGDVPSYYASPRTFGYALFREYGLAVQVVSFQLLFAAVGAYYVGRSENPKGERP